MKQVRWEVAKALGAICYAESIQSLVEALKTTIQTCHGWLPMH
jgi:HEAT repeat protein